MKVYYFFFKKNFLRRKFNQKSRIKHIIICPKLYYTKLNFMNWGLKKFNILTGTTAEAFHGMLHEQSYMYLHPFH